MFINSQQIHADWHFSIRAETCRGDYKCHNGDQNVTKNPPVVYDGYVKYEEAEIHRSAIMQDFRNSEFFFFFKWPTGSHFGFLSVKFIMGYSCVRQYILFYIHGPVILHFLS